MESEVSDSDESLVWNVEDNVTSGHTYGLSEEDGLDDYNKEDSPIDHLDSTRTESGEYETEQYTIQQPCIDAQTAKDLLPFPHLPRTWYAQQERLYNSARDARRSSNPIQRDRDNTIIGMNRTQVHGCLEDNLESLRTKISSVCSESTRQHFKGLCEVAEFIINKGPLVRTQTAGEVYLRCKNLQRCLVSTMRFFPNI